MPKEFSLASDVGNIAFKVWNEDLADRVLALHGWLDNLATFEPLAAKLTHMRIHGCDLPGHGLSDHLVQGPPYHIIDSAYDIHAILDALKWDDAHIIGHSMGAGIAMVYAAADPASIKSLVLLEGLGPLSSPPEECVDRLQTHMRQRRRLKGKRMPVYENEIQGIAARVAAAEISETAARLISQRGLKKVDGGFTWRTDARLRTRSPQAFSEEQVCAYIRNISCPVLFIRARQGFPFGDAILEGRMRCFQNLEYYELDGNHHVHIDRADEVASIIEGFYGKLLRSTTASVI